MRSYHDSVNQILQMVGASLTDGRSLQLAKLAVQEAQQLLMSERDWKYLDRWFKFTTDASYATGTITYDHTGGSSERLVTLAAGTWPTWAGYGMLLVDRKMYQVERRLSDTTLTLTEQANPGSDLAALTEYEIYREAYTLPADFNLTYSLNRVNDWDPRYVTPGEFEAERESQEYTGQPRVFSILRDPVDVERQAIWFYPGPNSAESFQAFIQRRPVELKTFDYQTGTASTTAGAVAVTSSGAAFDSNMVGAVIRFGDATSVPNSLESGSKVYDHEAEIVAVPTSSTLTLAQGASKTSSSVKFRISSRIDTDSGSLWVALMSCARWRFRVLTQAAASQVTQGFNDYRTALFNAAMDDGSKNLGSRAAAESPVSAALNYPQVNL